MSIATFVTIETELLTRAVGGAIRNPQIKENFDKLRGGPRHDAKVDHACALFVGGRDIVGNMQYQPTRIAAIKDHLEGTPLGHALFCDSDNSTPTRQVFNRNHVESD